MLRPIVKIRSSPSGVGPMFVDAETPSGSINGSNKTFTLAHTPAPATSLVVFVNGIRQKLTTHYTLSGLTLTMVRAYPSGTDISVSYRYSI